MLEQLRLVIFEIKIKKRRNEKILLKSFTQCSALRVIRVPLSFLWNQYPKYCFQKTYNGNLCSWPSKGKSAVRNFKMLLCQKRNVYVPMSIS